MEPENSLLVLIVRDAGLRSMLAARLSLAGIDVLSAREFDDPALARRRLHNATLVLDAATVDDAPAGWLDALRDEPRWRRVVVLVGAPRDSSNKSDDRLLFVPHGEAAQALIGLAGPRPSDNDV